MSTPLSLGVVNFRDLSNNTNERWWLDSSLRWNVFHCVGLCSTLFFNGYDGSLFNGLQSIDQWQAYFGHPDSVTLGLMNSSGFLPGIVASFFGDRVSQYFGRRCAVWLGTSIVGAGAILMSLSTSTGMFCGGRVVMGFGTSTALAVAPSLLQEIAHPRFRAQISCFYTCIYYIAAVVSACACLGCMRIPGEYAWRIPCYLQLAGPVATILLTCGMPESPRWLAKNDRTDDALRVLGKYHANGKEDDELVAYQYREIIEALEDEGRNSQMKYADLLKGRPNQHRLAINIIIAVGTNWVGNGIVSYYLNPILSSLGLTTTQTQLEILIGLHAFNCGLFRPNTSFHIPLMFVPVIVSALASFYVDKVGRRPLWLGSTAGMMITFCFVMGFSAGYTKTGQSAIGAAAIPFLFLFYGSYDLAWTPLAYSYPVEIFPFSLRTKAQAVFIATQTLAVSVNTWVNPIALEALSWKYYAVYIGILAVLCVIIYFFFPETKGLTIEEIGLVFDKDEAVGVRQAASHGKATSAVSIHEDGLDKD